MQKQRQPPIQDLAHFAGIVCVYAVAWFPFLGQLVLNDRRPLWLVGPLFVLLVYAGLRWRTLVPIWLRAVLAVPYWGLLLFFHILFGTMSHWMSPGYFWLCLVLAVAMALPRIGPYLVRPVTVAAPVLLLVSTVRDVYWYAPWAAAAWFGLCVLLSAGLVWLNRDHRLISVSRATLAFFLFALLIYPRGGVIYKLVFPGRLDAVLARAGVTAVFDYSDPRARREIGSQTMFLARVPGESVFVTGPQTPCRNVVVIRLGSETEYAKVELGMRGGDNILFDPDDPRQAYVGTVFGLVHLSLEPPRVLRTLRLQSSFHNLNFLHYDAPRDRIFVSFDFHPEIAVIDRTTFEKVGAIPCPRRTRTHDLWLDPVGGQVTVSATYPFGWRIDTYDLDTFERKRTYRWPWNIGFHFTTVDPEGRRMYLASTASGQVRVLDLDSLEEVFTFYLEPGLRNLNFDASRRLVLISSYFHGNLFVWDADAREFVGSLNLGRRLRWVEVDPENGLWYAATAVGGFAIDPNAAFPEWRSQNTANAPANEEPRNPSTGLQ